MLFVYMGAEKDKIFASANEKEISQSAKVLMEKKHFKCKYALTEYMQREYINAGKL
jgi:hypothetical protein